MHFWARGTSSFTLACLVLMHVEKLISSLLVAIPSPSESSLLRFPGPVLMQGHQKHIVRLSFPASDDPLLSCCIALFNFLLFILSCQYKMHHVPLHGSPPVCSRISRLSTAAQRHFHLWVMHGMLPSQPSENRQHHANSTFFRPGSCCLDQPLHYTQQSSVGTHLHCKAAALPSAIQQAAFPSHSQPDHLQSQLLAELNKHSGWHVPDKALFYSAKQCHTSYLTQIRSVAPVVLQSSNLTLDTLV